MAGRKKASDPPPLIRAMREGTVKEATKRCLQLIAEGADVNCCNGEGTPALMFASFFGLEKVVYAMLDKGVDVKLNDGGELALRSAVRRNHAGIVEALLEKGTNPNLRIDDIYQVNTLLVSAARRGNFMLHADNIRIVTALIKAGADLDVRMEDGKTVTEVATLLGRHDFLALIAQQRARIEQQAEIKRQEEAQQRLNNAVNIIQGGLKDGMMVRALKKKIQPNPSI
jgi:hypothetical protein